MRILVYEFVTGGGWYSAALGNDFDSDSFDSDSFDKGLLAEGAAMARAMVEDLAQLAGVVVTVLRDRRLAHLDFPVAEVHEVSSACQEQELLARLSRDADATLLIAPEFAGHLAHRARLVEQSGGRLLGPASHLIELAADKHALAVHLARHGVLAPRGVLLEAGEPLPCDVSYPAVLKPRDGAGSLGLERIERWEAGWVAPTSLWPDQNPKSQPWRLESYCPGLAASVVCLCGPRQILPLVPCRQLLSGDGRFTYQGGSAPLPTELAVRARDLAARAVQTLAGACGYLGVDLVLGADPGGRDDVVIEINPRLTTSYVGLRRLARGNLAEALVAIARGGQAQVGWHEGQLEFDVTGRVHFATGETGLAMAIEPPMSRRAGDELAESSSV